MGPIERVIRAIHSISCAGASFLSRGLGRAFSLPLPLESPASAGGLGSVEIADAGVEGPGVEGPGLEGAWYSLSGSGSSG